MKHHAPRTDRELLLGAILIAVSISGIGILGGQSASVDMAWVQPQGMNAAIAAPTTSAQPAKQLCLPKNETDQADVNTKCFDGCHYIVTAGSLPAKASVTSTQQYSDGSKNPGTVQFQLAGTWKALTCQGGSASTNTLGAAKGDGVSRGLASIVGTESNSMNMVPQTDMTQQMGTAAGSAGGQGASTGAGTEYSSTNLPTQQGCYATNGGTMCYTPATGNTPAQYQYFGPVGGSNVPGPGEVEADPAYAKYMAGGSLDQALGDTGGVANTSAAPRGSIFKGLNPSMDNGAVGDIETTGLAGSGGTSKVAPEGVLQTSANAPAIAGSGATSNVAPEGSQASGNTPTTCPWYYKDPTTGLCGYTSEQVANNTALQRATDPYFGVPKDDPWLAQYKLKQTTVCPATMIVTCR